jgi:hypothetical protein
VGCGWSPRASTAERIHRSSFVRGVQPDQFDVDRSNAEGRLLAVALKQRVGPATKVLFVSERADGHSGVEEEIV